MTYDVKEKAIDLWRAIPDCLDADEEFHLCLAALTEARNAGIEEAAKVCRGMFKSLEPENAAFIAAAHLCAGEIDNLKDKTEE